MSEEWLSSGEAASRLGINPRTLYRLINEGQLPGFRIGKNIRVKAADVEAFLNASQITPGELDHLMPEQETS